MFNTIEKVVTSNAEILLIQNDNTSVFQVIADKENNYSFTPTYVSHGILDQVEALVHFNETVATYS